AVDAPHRVRAQQRHRSLRVHPDGREPRQHGGHAVVVVGDVLLHHAVVALPAVAPPRPHGHRGPTQHGHAVAGGQGEDVGAGDGGRALTLDGGLDGGDVLEVAHAEAAVGGLLGDACGGGGVEQQGGVAGVDHAVVEECPQPRHRRVAVLLVQPPHLLPHHLLRPRAPLRLRVEVELQT
ncbi:Os07g0694325, partial [Oryza sativa Japonica Group]